MTVVAAREAATIILLRPAEPFEVLLVKRHSQSRFMADSFVFPGGKIDEGESPEVAATRELLEEAGVLLAKSADGQVIATLRRRLAQEPGTFHQLLAGAHLEIDRSALVYWAHWVTPSLEPRRFSARFFLARMPQGQLASFDQLETTDQKWIKPADAVLQHEQGTLKLPPPTLRNLAELATFGDLDSVFAHGRAHETDVVAIMPKIVDGQGAVTLLLPWDPDYASAAGEGVTVPADHRLRQTPSRIVLENGRWWSRTPPPP